MEWSGVYTGSFYPAVGLSVLLEKAFQYKGDIAFLGGYLKKRLSEHIDTTKSTISHGKFQTILIGTREVNKKTR